MTGLLAQTNAYIRNAEQQHRDSKARQDQLRRPVQLIDRLLQELEELNLKGMKRVPVSYEPRLEEILTLVAPVQSKDLFEARLIGDRNALHSLEIQLLELLQQPVDQLHRSAELVLASLRVPMLLFGVTDVGVGLSKQSCHQRTLISCRRKR